MLWVLSGLRWKSDQVSDLMATHLHLTEPLELVSVRYPGPGEAAAEMPGLPPLLPPTWRFWLADVASQRLTHGEGWPRATWSPRKDGRGASLPLCCGLSCSADHTTPPSLHPGRRIPPDVHQPQGLPARQKSRRHSHRWRHRGQLPLPWHTVRHKHSVFTGAHGSWPLLP